MSGVILFSFVALIISAGNVRAEDRNPRATKVAPEMKNVTGQNNAMGKTASSTEGYGDERTMKREEKIGHRFEKIDKVFKIHINTLDMTAKLIADKIAKFEAKGRDMTKAKQLLGEARTKIDIAKNTLKTFEDSAKAATTQLTKQTLQKLKDDSKKVTDSIKSAHRALVAVRVEITPGREGMKNASTTPTGATGSTTVNQDH